MTRVVHFEISANDPEKQAKFYRGVFDWEVRKWEGPVDYWLIRTGEDDTPGINGGFFTPEEEFTGTINTVEVDDVDAYAEKVKKNGGTVVVEKQAIPGVGYLVYCKDPEGTIFGLHKEDPSAGQ